MEHDSFGRRRVRETADHRARLLELLFSHDPRLGGRSETTQHVVKAMAVLSNVGLAGDANDHQEIVVAVRPGVPPVPANRTG